MGQNWLYLLVKAFENCSFSEKANNVIQYGSLYGLHHSCLELQLVKQSICQTGVQEGGGVSKTLYIVWEQEFVCIQLKLTVI